MCQRVRAALFPRTNSLSKFSADDTLAVQFYLSDSNLVVKIYLDMLRVLIHYVVRS